MAYLQKRGGSDAGRLYPLDGQQFVLGRHLDCDIHEIFFDTDAVSRRHTLISREGDRLFVEDLNSRNGTLLNGARVTGRVQLCDRDCIGICGVELTFFIDRPQRVRHENLRSHDVASTKALIVDDALDSNVISTANVLSSSSMVARGSTANSDVKLRALVEMLGNLGKSLKPDDVLDSLISGLFKIFPQADRGFVGLKAGEHGPVIPRFVKYRKAGRDEPMRVSRTIINRVMQTKQAILSSDATLDERFRTSQSIADFRIRSFMCAPLLDADNNSLGVIQVDTLDKNRQFPQDDLEVLASVAPQAANALRYAELHQQALRQQSLDQDLQLARRVQQGLLPAGPPKIKGYQFHAHYKSAAQVGGDYYDYISLSGGRWAVVVADVSGKGISAALVMANLSGELKYYLARESTPIDAVNALNRRFRRTSAGERFVTMVLAVIDPSGSEITLVNAGHMAPLLRLADGKVQPLGEDVRGMALGVDSRWRYKSCKQIVAPGQMMTLFTDGLTEAMNANDQLYGVERLCQQLRGDAPDLAAYCKRILLDVRRFTGKKTQTDDLCLVTFGRAAE